MTRGQFRARAQRAVADANPDATPLTIEWEYGPERVTWADGTTGWTGILRLSAPGYRTRTAHASTLDDRVTVR